MSIQIDRCLCFNQSFAALKAQALEHHCTSLEALQEVICFGKKCRLCHPYVRRMLQTGETVFHEILREPAADTLYDG
ncbi:MAG: (2Fe-2S)-binding protein [Candidatus Sericytochromatia bacterium]